MLRWNIYKAFLVLIVLFALIMVSGEYLKPWFLFLWGAAAILTIIRMEIKGFMGSSSELHLPPASQLAIAISLVVAAAFATEWSRLSFSSLLPWAYAGFALPSYRQGYVWGWSQLQSGFKNG